MQHHFEQFIRNEHLFPEGEQVLLAVSGGRDSVALANLVYTARIPFAIAHCNFHLRPGDCDRDETFVRSLADTYGVPCYVAQFDTNEYAAANHQSIEEAARNLRYRFFEQTLDSHNLAVVATAHHRDDAIETFFINLLRGTGIAGLQGIPLRNNRIVRPLLPFGRDEINAYISQHNLSYVEDTTNNQPLYLRNRIRLQLIPLLQSLSPSFFSTMQSNINHLGDAYQIYQSAIREVSQRLLVPASDGYTIDISQLRQLSPLSTFLFELVRPFGFTPLMAEEILSSLDAQSGKQFFSTTHKIVKDRERLIITPLTIQQSDSYIISRLDEIPELPISLGFSVFSYDGTPVRLAPHQAWFDLDQLQFPLTLRHWNSGDRFKPFGMKGSRLVSDLLNDLKISRPQKDRTWILNDADENILWVVGLRASSVAVVTGSTQRILQISC